MTKKKSKNVGAKAGIMTVTYSGEIGLEEDLPTLERKRDLASARYAHALQMQRFWQQESWVRMAELNVANLRYLKKKNGFTDKEVEENKPAASSVWTYEAQTG